MTTEKTNVSMTFKNTRSGKACLQDKVGFIYLKVFEKSNNN